jgi:putative hydrolase of the HAD superfamily
VTDIKLVAFDLGNVLCAVDETIASKKLSTLSDKPWEEVHGIVFSQIRKLQFESGEMTFDEHAVQAISNLGIDMPLDEFTDLYDSVLIPSESMLHLVERIAETHRLALVSNTSEPHWKSAERFLPFSSSLDPVIVSYEVGSMKPQPAFYDALLERSGVLAANMLFVDDLAANIEGAETAGMIGHQFTSQGNLEIALGELGII